MPYYKHIANLSDSEQGLFPFAPYIYSDLIHVFNSHKPANPTS